MVGYCEHCGRFTSITTGKCPHCENSGRSDLAALFITAFGVCFLFAALVAYSLAVRIFRLFIAFILIAIGMYLERKNKI